MLAVEVRLRGVGDEELAAVGVRARVGHREHAALVAQRVALRLVAEGVARAARARALGAAALDHEVGDHAVELQAVVEAAPRERDEVVDRLRGVLGKQVEHDVAALGLDRRLVASGRVDGHLGGGGHNREGERGAGTREERNGRAAGRSGSRPGTHGRRTHIKNDGAAQAGRLRRSLYPGGDQPARRLTQPGRAS